VHLCLAAGLCASGPVTCTRGREREVATEGRTGRPKRRSQERERETSTREREREKEREIKRLAAAAPGNVCRDCTFRWKDKISFLGVHALR
jgi:hypothetical protein